jgi:hypothetical protein
MPSRFPPPWSIVELEESFAVRDASGFTITWVHFRKHEVIGTNADRMTRDQARRVAVNIARLPTLMGLEKAVREALDGGGPRPGATSAARQP